MQIYVKAVGDQFMLINLTNVEVFSVVGAEKVWGLVANFGQRFASVATVNSQAEAQRCALELAALTGEGYEGRNGAVLIEWTGAGFSSKEL
ncbi:hypothetical protein [Arthrobacter sp. SLBN-122]|uniref:hypothetical protein n=1 Tax=Arthrobacter sp. SLBN-122 TaxID=2768455 RepID=UPI001152441A|nr:hypothetical protein [Arthrobacter sp. SLBN-122]TQJ36735.1 hypothetical protein FBY36_4042 [Arthrobacter sp. SLBN-122]